MRKCLRNHAGCTLLKVFAPRCIRQGGGGQQLKIKTDGQPRTQIRMLTEKECFRLMGVKDEDYEKIAPHQSRTSRVHLAGDSIVTTCLMAIFGEMLEDIDYDAKIDEVIESIKQKGEKTNGNS